MSHPPINQQITFLYTPDLPSTARFYEEVLGLMLVLDQGACRIYRTGEGSYIGFCQRDDTKSDHMDVIFTLVTPQVDEWYQYLLKRGVTFEKPPALNPEFNIYHCFFRDVNGYLIEIQRFLDENWQISNVHSGRN
jgi:catechol 2,3-dioxygenase-like lactoylglutathione lyase family enzyme